MRTIDLFDLCIEILTDVKHGRRRLTEVHPDKYFGVSDPVKNHIHEISIRIIQTYTFERGTTVWAMDSAREHCQKWACTGSVLPPWSIYGTDCGGSKSKPIFEIPKFRGTPEPKPRKAGADIPKGPGSPPPETEEPPKAEKKADKVQAQMMNRFMKILKIAGTVKNPELRILMKNKLEQALTHIELETNSLTEDVLAVCESVESIEKYALMFEAAAWILEVPKSRWSEENLGLLSPALPTQHKAIVSEIEKIIDIGLEINGDYLDYENKKNSGFTRRMICKMTDEIFSALKKQLPDEPNTRIFLFLWTFYGRVRHHKLVESAKGERFSAKLKGYTPGIAMPRTKVIDLK